MGTVAWASAGGDHSTDFWGTYNGINLSYGRKSGFGSYGPKFMKRGARIFDLSINRYDGSMNIDTWIRQQDGSIDDQEYSHPPAAYSWLNKNYCHGSEKIHSQIADLLPVHIDPDNGWVPIPV